MAVAKRNNVNLTGTGLKSIVFAHGFGCDQNMWRYVAPAFAGDFRILLFDHVGHGQSDISAYSAARYSNLAAYADDLIEICRDAGVISGTFVGHSVSAMIGIIASLKAPELFESLILIGPSPRYINDDDYVGGFDAEQIGELLKSLDDNHLGWSRTMAPVIMGNSDRSELGQELTNSFCRTDPAIARDFARATFLSDNRADLPLVMARTLILQCSDDIIAPVQVGEYVRDHVAGSTMIQLAATGHCPNLSAPDEVIAAIRTFI